MAHLTSNPHHQQLSQIIYSRFTLNRCHGKDDLCLWGTEADSGWSRFCGMWVWNSQDEQRGLCRDPGNSPSLSRWILGGGTYVSTQRQVQNRYSKNRPQHRIKGAAGFEQPVSQPEATASVRVKSSSWPQTWCLPSVSKKHPQHHLLKAFVTTWIVSTVHWIAPLVLLLINCNDSIRCYTMCRREVPWLCVLGQSLAMGRGGVQVHRFWTSSVRFSLTHLGLRRLPPSFL